MHAPKSQSWYAVTAEIHSGGASMLQELLLKAVVLQEDWDGLPTAARAAIASETSWDKVRDELVEWRLLTEYQAGRISAGQMGGLILGNYRVLERIGAGGMGVVFKAEHIIMRRFAAIKILPQSFDDDNPMLTRFIAEMRALARLQHPNIVEAFEAGRTSEADHDFANLYYFVMEYVPGMDLEQFVNAHGPLSPTKACDMAYQVASALSEAHRKNLVHRDIKPSNILMTVEGQAKLTDFGLARHFQHRNVTQPGVALGTVDYMAPEQAQDASSVDIRADIFSLGATLFWSLTGELPFKHTGNLLSALIARQGAAPPSARRVRSETPVELDALLSRCMALKPQDRFADPNELMQALLRFLKTQSIHEIQPELAGSPRGAGRQNGDSRTGTSPPRVLIVDDDATLRSLIRYALDEQGVVCHEVENGQQALDTMQEQSFDLIFMDMEMPMLDGRQTLKRIRERPPCPNVKIIMMSGKIAPDQMAQLLATGADDFIPKPASLVQLQARARYALTLKAAQDKSDRLNLKLQSANAELARSLTNKEDNLIQARNNLILALAELAALRTGEPDGHLTRMPRYCRILADEAADSPAFAGRIDRDFVAMLECCAPLHDIGQVALPDHLLQKVGKLDPDERQLIQTHTSLGADMLDRVFQRTPSALVIIQMAIEITRHHHERYDGAGYPDKLAGEAIPLAARLVAIADVYDALRSRRLHRPALSHRVAVEMMTSSEGQFDPALIPVFKACVDRFDQVFRECA